MNKINKKYQYIKERKIPLFKDLERFKTMEENAILETFNNFDLYPVWQFQIGKYVADFVFEEEKICIEIDGGIHKIWNNKSKDALKDSSYRNEGWKIIRIKYDNLEDEWEEIKDKIIDICYIIKQIRISNL